MNWTQKQFSLTGVSLKKTKFLSIIVDTSRNRRMRFASAIVILALIGGVAVCIGGSGADSGDAGKAGSLRLQQIERLKLFSAEKEKQSQLLAAAAGETISPEYQKFFRAATIGDWQTVTNMYESFKQRHGQYGNALGHSDPSLRTSFWGAVLEISLAYDNVVLCEPEYTQMAADGIVNSMPAGSIYFGGTDFGRGLPTAFCKSHVNADPFYTLTQNALADGTYLDYLRKTYGMQKELLPQLAEACRADAQLKTVNSTWTAAVRKLQLLDINRDDPQWNEAEDALRKLWTQRDDRVKEILAGIQVRATNQTWSKAIYIPTGEDSQRCFEEYVADARKRADNHQLKQGENFKEEQGRVQISGQTAVMEINGLLVKTILDKNPDREFYIEESFPLDWMYPNLEPHGLIFKLNRQPIAAVPDEGVRQDREYWQPRVKQMIGGWLNDDTPVADVAAFAEKIFLRHDLGGFSADARYVQNDWATKMFAKMRVAIAGLYAWRAEHSDSSVEKERMTRAADFAFRQAVALGPNSPEATHRYAEFLKAQHREADAGLVTELAEKFKVNADGAATPAKSSVFQMRLVLDAPSENTEALTNVFQIGLTGNGRTAEVLNLQKTILLDQMALKSAKLLKNQQGLPQINIRFTEAGRKQFAEITRQHLHQRLAIVIDGKLVEAPVIQSEIPSGEAIITGSFSEGEAKTLTAKINAAIAR